VMECQAWERSMSKKAKWVSLSDLEATRLEEATMMRITEGLIRIPSLTLKALLNSQIFTIDRFFLGGRPVFDFLFYFYVFLWALGPVFFFFLRGGTGFVLGLWEGDRGLLYSHGGQYANFFFPTAIFFLFQIWGGTMAPAGGPPPPPSLFQI
jgi:hypothetical protein